MQNCNLDVVIMILQVSIILMLTLTSPKIRVWSRWDHDHPFALKLSKQNIWSYDPI